MPPGLSGQQRAQAADRFYGIGDLPFWYRRPLGPGWALVGDAGYHKDPITALGITDAFLDAETLTGALDDVFAGRRAYEEALSGYQQARDARSRPFFELTCEFARLEPPPPELQQLFAAIHGNREAMDAFVRMNAGTTSPAEFFAPDNVRAIMASADARA